MKINQLTIKNFKSIRDLTLKCRRINVFIGEANVGKSNILEVIGLISHIYHSETNIIGIKDFVRMESMLDLFYNKNTKRKIEIKFNQHYLKVFREEYEFRCVSHPNEDSPAVFSYSYEGKGSRRPDRFKVSKYFKFYRFKILKMFRQNMYMDYLAPPDGRNLISLLVKSEEIKNIIRDIISSYNYKLVIEEFENKIKIEREIDEGILMSFPIYMLSETLYRLIFYLAAISSNKDSILAFEEPEIHTYPYYTKYLAERIANDKSNQYLLTTHNPYMLIPLIEKTKNTDISVNITYMKRGETKVYMLNDNEIELLLDMDLDALINLDRFLKKLKKI